MSLVLILCILFLRRDIFLDLHIVIWLWSFTHEREVFDLYLIILFVFDWFILQKLVVGGGSFSVLRRFWWQAFGLEKIESAVGSLSQLYFVWLKMIDYLAWGLVDFDAIDLHRIVEYVLRAILLFLIRHRLELLGVSILIQEARIILNVNDRPHIGIDASHALRVTAWVQANLVVDIDWSVMVIIWIPDIGFIWLCYALYRSNHWTKYGCWGLALRPFSLMTSGWLLRIIGCIRNIPLLNVLALSLLVIVLIFINRLHSLALCWFDIWMGHNRPCKAWSLCVRIIWHWISSLTLGASVWVSSIIDWLIDAHEARNISQNIFEVLINLLSQVKPIFVD